MDAPDSNSAPLDSTFQSVGSLRTTHEAFKARFGPRNVIECTPEQDISLNTYNGKKPLHQKKAAIQAIQLSGKIQNLTSKKKLIDFIPVPQACIPFTPGLWKPDLIENDVDIYLPEKILLADLIPDGRCFRLLGVSPLFNHGMPEVKDIAQLHKRSTCYLLSTLAAYVATPIGNELIKRSMCQFQDGLVGVTLHDSVLTERDVKVLISNQRPVDIDGKDLYSFTNTSEAHWPGYFEKAYHAFLLGCRANIETMKSERPEQDLSYLDSLFRSLAGDRKPNRMIDHMDMSMPIGVLPSMPALKSSNPLYKQGNIHEKIDLSADQLHSTYNKNLIRFNIEQGIPVVMGTLGGLKGGIQAAFSGTPTKHALAVIGPAKNSEGKEGFLTYDPYGESLSEKPVPDLNYRQKLAMTGGKPTMDIKSRGEAITFNTYDKITDRFDRVTIARGGFMYDKDHLQQAHSETVKGEDSDDEWEVVSTTQSPDSSAS